MLCGLLSDRSLLCVPGRRLVRRRWLDALRRVPEFALNRGDALAHRLCAATILVDLDGRDDAVVRDGLVGGLDGGEHLLDAVGFDDRVRRGRLVADGKLI